ncbi:MAG: GAF domain-containing protein [Alloprevotella sp.]|nr:GAF domain-containing protein [Alloprevotella sp.]
MNTIEKSARYDLLLKQAVALVDGETDAIAIQANISALLKETFGFHWVGFYRVAGSELILGPFQGPPACVHIGYGKGVCGTCWETATTQVVPDVDKFPGHIACSSLSRSEIVVPVFDAEKKVCAVLDIDSADLDTFDATDAVALETLCAKISDALFRR